MKQTIITLAIMMMLVSIISATIDIQSPEASSFSDVGMGSEPGPDGNIGFSLPIGTVTGREGISLPLTLSYGSGIRLDQEASWAGLGFSLGFGAISRSPVGLADDYDIGLFRSNNPKDGEYQDLDYYSLNFPGGGGKLIYDQATKTFYPANWQEMKIEFFDAAGNTVHNGLTGQINEWKVTTADGVIYIFGGAGAKAESSMIVTSGSFTRFDGGSQGRNYNNNTEINDNLSSSFVSTWYLREIRSPNYEDTNSNGILDDADAGGWIKIIYEDLGSYKYIFPNPRTFDSCEIPTTCNVLACSDGRAPDNTLMWYTWAHCTAGPVFQQFSKFQYVGIGRRTSPDGGVYTPTTLSVLFTKRTTYTDMLYPKRVESPQMTSVLSFDTTSRTDGRDHSGIGETATYYTNLDSGKQLARLNSVDFFNNGDLQNPISSTEFFYAADADELANNSEGIANDGRLTLTGIQTTGLNGEKLPKISFDYYRQDLPYHRYAWDWWGYHNGKLDNAYFNLQKIDQYCSFVDTYGHYPNNCDGFRWDIMSAYFEGRSSDFTGSITFDYPMPDHTSNQYADAWSIRKVTYSTGGSIEYEYEPGNYEYELAQCIDRDDNDVCDGSVTAGIRIKNKTVDDGFGHTYSTSYTYGDGVATEDLYWQSKYKNDWSSSGPHLGNGIYYTQVVTHSPDNSGRVETNYDLSLLQNMDTYACTRTIKVAENLARDDIKTTFTRNVYLSSSPFLVRPSVTRMYAGDGTLQQEVVSSSVIVQKFAYEEGDVGGVNYNNHENEVDCNANYVLRSDWLRTDSSSTTLYDQNGAVDITSTQTMEYNAHGFPTTKTTTNSDGMIRTEKTEYLGDLPPSGTASEIAAQQLALLRNQLSLPKWQKVLTQAPGEALKVDAYSYSVYNIFGVDADGYSMSPGKLLGNCVSAHCAVLPYQQNVWIKDEGEFGIPEGPSVDDYTTTTLEKVDVYGQPLISEDPKLRQTTAYYGDNGACNNNAAFSNNVLITCVKDSNQNTVKAFYDDKQRMVAMQDANDHYTHYYYDDLNRMYAASVPSKARNLLLNPGFELGKNAIIKDWTLSSATRYHVLSGMDTDFIYSGGSSLRVLTGGTVVQTQQTTAQAGQSYWLSGWIRRIDGLLGGAVYLDLVGTIGGNFAEAGYNVIGTPVNDQWYFVKGQVFVPANIDAGSVKIRAVVESGVSAPIYFDDISLSTDQPFDSAPFYIGAVTSYNYGILDEAACPYGLNEYNEKCLNWVQTLTISDDDDISVGRSYVDGLGRAWQTATLQDWDTSIYIRTNYNARGLVDFVTQPLTHTVDFTEKTLAEWDGKSTAEAALAPVFKEVTLDGTSSFDAEKADGGEGGESNIKYVYYNDPLGRVSKVFPLSSFDQYTDADRAHDCGWEVNKPLLGDKLDCTQSIYAYTGNEFPECAASNTQYTCTKTIDAEGKFVVALMDIFGNTLKVTNMAQETTRFDYDPLGRVEKVWDAETGGAKSLLVPAKENMYNVAGQLTLARDVNTIGDTEYVYDANGNIEYVYEAVTNHDLAHAGRTTHFVYDNLDRVQEIRVKQNGVAEVVTKKNYYGDYPNMNCRTCANGGDCDVGLLCKTEDKIYGTSVEYQYDTKGQLSQVRETFNGKTYTTTYNYNKAGGLQKITMDNGEWISYNYNMLSQLESAQIKEVQGTFDFSYEDFGAIKTIDYPNQVTQNFDYTAKKFVERITVSPDPSTGNPTNQFQEFYVYDNVGNLETIENELTGGSASFGYDPSYRLETVTDNGYYDVNGFSLNSLLYDYDKVGNRKERVVDAPANDIVASDTYTYFPNSDRLETTNGCTYSYDDYGNMIRKACTDGVTEYSYDVNNMISRIKLASGYLMTFKYDALGRRVYKNYFKINSDGSQAGTATEYIYGSGSNALIVNENKWTSLAPPPNREETVAPDGQIGLVR